MKCPKCGREMEKRVIDRKRMPKWMRLTEARAGEEIEGAIYHCPICFSGRRKRG